MARHREKEAAGGLWRGAEVGKGAEAAEVGGRAEDAEVGFFFSPIFPNADLGQQTFLMKG